MKARFRSTSPRRSWPQEEPARRPAITPVSNSTLYHRPATIVAAGLLLVSVATVSRAASWNEIVFGDLSNDPGNPTPLEIVHPDEAITGITGGGDFDFIDIEVPAFHKLESVVVNDYTGATQSFAGLQLGSVWTAGTGVGVNAALLLGWTHFGPAASGAGLGSDILDDLATPKNGSAGFTRPLGPGHYTLLLQDTGAEVGYSLQFNLSYNLRPVGDFNGDFLINRFDVAKWRFEYGMNAGSDADADGDSDGADFLVWQRQLGSGSPTSSAANVPEPAGLLMAAFALVAVRLASKSGDRERPRGR
jgi:hypothetical protein